ncbi:MAG: TIGR01777 family oxidoreductase [Candidatus Methylomirabilota bacterium]
MRRCQIAAPVEAAFRWHARPGALERLTPPWERISVEERTGGIEAGSRVSLRMGFGPIGVRWIVIHRDCVEGEQFRDEQVQGPFARWVHTHRFRPDGLGAAILEDQIEYQLPYGWVGDAIGGAAVRRKLHRIFAYRHAVTQADIETHVRAGKGEAMQVAVSGSSGLVGSALLPFLTAGGHRISRLVRKAAGGDDIAWDIAQGVKELSRLEGVDAVVHLAGENIAAGRWTAARKEEIRRSRVEGTRRLCESLAKLSRRPKVLVSASAVGFYGNRGEEILREDSAPGSDFLAQVCREWEAATDPASRAGIRVVHLRSGVILSPAGGALKKMLLPFKMGAGGRMGSGAQFMSWIAIDDAVGAIHHAIVTESLQGPVNGVAPTPVSNVEFTRTLGRVLSRPAIVPMPAFAARLAFGEMADALLLASQRVIPARLQATGYRFRHAELEGALRHLLGR